MKMSTPIPYRQHNPEAVTMDTTEAAARARLELAAMEGIAELLARLPDIAARARVLQWADGIFRQDEPTPSPMPAATPLHVVRPAALCDSKVDLPKDWGLSVGDFEDWFEKDSTHQPEDLFPEAGSPQPVVSMIHGFVADFQKLARDWQED